MTNKPKKKQWTIKSLDGTKVSFAPKFEEVTDTKDRSPLENEIECRYVEIEIDQGNGNPPIRLVFNYLDLYMFMYFIGNEELRMGLAKRYERKVSYIPYDVSFKISEKEKREGSARRRIEVPVDELTMAIARNEAFQMLIKNAKGDKLPNPKDFVYKKKGKDIIH